MSGQDLSGAILPAGSRLGPYEIVRLLGSGTFAHVYLARHTLLEKDVALKVLHTTETEAGEVQGAKIMCRLKHANIVSVHFADRVEGRLVIAMDYVEGKTLRGILNDSAPLELAKALEIASAVAGALDYIHTVELDGSLDLAHLDLKPSNILVDSKGAIKITDFGMAQVRHGELIHAGGSPAYMAPEQFDCKPSAKSDIWAVGVFLYEMLLGSPPFRAESIEEYRRKICEAGPELGSGFQALPTPVKEIILRCLQRNPDERFGSARELSAVLDAVTSRTDSASCPRCGASLPAGSDFCSECTFLDEKKTQRFEVPRWIFRKKTPKSSKAIPWVISAILILLVVSTYGAYRFWKNWRPEQVARQAIAESGRPGLSLSARESVLKKALAQVHGGAAQSELQEKLRELDQAGDAWGRILKLERSVNGSYQDKTQALKAFLQGYPEAAEAKEAADKLRIWEDEGRRFEEVQELERRPGARICEHLAKWNEFYALQKTGFRRARAWERIQFWTKEVENYSGYAELTVRSASGLPPSDTGLLGSEQPDPYFVLLEKNKILYESRVFKDNPAPVWEEKVRIFISPQSDVVLEIRDKDPIGHDLLFRQKLVPLPVDGMFRFTRGTIQVETQIIRER